MDRLFLDANILFSAAYRPNAGLVRLWELKGVTLLSSPYAIEEARRNLRTTERLMRLDGLLSSITRVPAVSTPRDMRGDIELPEKDWPILGGAVAAGATHLITGDVRDFGAYFGQEVMGVLVLPPAIYLAGHSG